MPKWAIALRITGCLPRGGRCPVSSVDTPMGVVVYSGLSVQSGTPTLLVWFGQGGGVKIWSLAYWVRTVRFWSMEGPPTPEIRTFSGTEAPPFLIIRRECPFVPPLLWSTFFFLLQNPHRFEKKNIYIIRDIVKLISYLPVRYNLIHDTFLKQGRCNGFY
jgi:hypothetical protein